MNEILIIIPSLNPDEKLIEVIKSLKKIGFSKILLVDDGSEDKKFFLQGKNEFNCELITHAENKGKGRALKTGFEYALTLADIHGVVTVDGDNQHKADDVLLVSEKLCQSENSMVLGVRNFTSTKNIPFRSRFGNKCTSCFFQMISGVKIQDTQTGLRGIPFSHLEKLLNIQGERFEFEMNVLLQIKKLGLNLQQIPIKTIYLEENKSSHFRPIIDSFQVCNMIFKFVAVSLLCFLVDYIIFSIILFLFETESNQTMVIFLSSVIARVCSSVLNFILNYRVVFQSEANKKASFFKYYTLVLIQMLVSSSLTAIISKFLDFPLIIKPIVDLLLFFISYHIQKAFIFIKKGEINEKNMS